MVSKRKAPVQDYAQPKRFPMGRPFTMHEGASSGVKSREAISLQRDDDGDDDDDDDILVIIKLYITGSDRVRVQAGFLQKPEPDAIPYQVG